MYYFSPYNFLCLHVLFIAPFDRVHAFYAAHDNESVGGRWLTGSSQEMEFYYTLRITDISRSHVLYGYALLAFHTIFNGYIHTLIKQ